MGMKDGSLPHGDRNHMNDEVTGDKSIIETETDWAKLRQMTDEEIHVALQADTDLHPTDEAFWQDARVVIPQRKVVVTIRLDADLLEWLRREKGYQTRINAVLRAYMAAQVRKEANREVSYNVHKP